MAGTHARFVFMSAVAPNVNDLAAWLGNNPGGLTVTSRATAMRVGVFEHRTSSKRVEGWIKYTDGTELRVIDDGADRTQNVAFLNSCKSSAPLVPFSSLRAAEGPQNRSLASS